MNKDRGDYYLNEDMAGEKSRCVVGPGTAAKAMEVQVGGNHYKDMKIQPFEFSMANGFNAGQHSVIKYISRYKYKGGLEDLKKARHFIDMMIELEYPSLLKEN